MKRKSVIVSVRRPATLVLAIAAAFVLYKIISTTLTCQKDALTEEIQPNVRSPEINVEAQKVIDTCQPTPVVDCNDEKTSAKMTKPGKVYNVALFRKPFWVSIADFDFTRCEYSACRLQKENISESTDMVIVYTYDLRDSFMLTKRWPHQLVVAATWEPPVYTNASFLVDRKSHWNSAFNLTATYRMHADIFVPYGELIYVNITSQKPDYYYNIAKKKTKMAAWVVSRCVSQSKRDDYIKQMQTIIDVDKYGGCGQYCNTTTTWCSDEFATQYRFYLAFENSFCTDYLTEKFFKIFLENTHMVPVVRGGFKYNKYFPPKTFINAADFKTAAELALFLKRLSEDPLEYSEYLRRKDLYRYKGYSGEWTFGCEVCEYVHTRKVDKEIKDMKKWMGDEHCWEPKDL